MKLKITVLLLFGFIFLKCDKNESSEDLEFTYYPMNFEHLESGQIFRFVRLEAQDYNDNEKFDFTYTNDTLILEVLFKVENEIVIQESISPGSDMLESTDFRYWGQPKSDYTNIWTFRNDSLITNSSNVKFTKSHLLQRGYFPVEVDLTCKVEVEGWKTKLPYMTENKYLYTTDYELNQIEYDTLGIFMNNETMQSDGIGVTIFYHKKHGIVRTSAYDPWTRDGQGWDRIK